MTSGNMRELIAPIATKSQSLRVDFRREGVPASRHKGRLMMKRADQTAAASALWAWFASQDIRLEEALTLMLTTTGGVIGIMAPDKGERRRGIKLAAEVLHDEAKRTARLCRRRERV
jgi:hypothetical protein